MDTTLHMKLQELILEDPRRINALIHRLAHLLPELSTIDKEMRDAYHAASGNDFNDTVSCGDEVCRQNGLVRQEFNQLNVDPKCMAAIQKMLMGGVDSQPINWRLRIAMDDFEYKARTSTWYYYTEFTKKHVWYMLYAEIYKITHELCRLDAQGRHAFGGS